MHVEQEGIEHEHSKATTIIIAEFVVVVFIATLATIAAVVLEKKLRSLPVQEKIMNCPFLSRKCTSRKSECDVQSYRISWFFPNDFEP